MLQEEFIKQAYISIQEFYCKICEDNDENNFYTTTKNVCKSCLKLKQKQYYQDNKCQSPEDIENDFILKQRITQAKVRAAKKNIEFNIDIDDLKYLLHKQNFKCYYSNIIFDNTNKYYSLSLDRTNSEIGYVIGNIKLVCSIVNRMKLDLPEMEFLNIIKKIEKNLK